MSKILTTAFLLMLLIVLVVPQDCGYAMSPEDYGCLWWADGNPYYHDYRALPADNIPDDYPGKKQVLCFHTGRYGMAIDTINLNRMNLGAFDTLVPYEMGITEVHRAVFSLPESQLSLEVHANGRAYTCVGRQQPADHTLFPVRFVEYGRFFEHVSINGLILADREAAGNDLTIQMEEGKLVRNYPVEVSVSGQQRAQFAVSGGVGYVPVTFTGLEDCRDPKLYRVLNEKMTAEDQSVNGNDFWQTDYDPVKQTWSITYNINLDSSVKPGKPVTFLFR